MLHEIQFEDSQTFICRLSSHMFDQLRGSSCQQWMLIHELIQPPPPQIPCRLSWPIKAQIYLVSFQQYHVSGDWKSLTLYHNYPINQFRLRLKKQVRLHFKRQNRIRSRALLAMFFLFLDSPLVIILL